MELHPRIDETRIQEICDKYIAGSIKENKPISEDELAFLSCAELVVLYYNTQRFVEVLNGDNGITGTANQILLMELIPKRIKTSTLYVIHTDATDMPFLTENKTVLVYTDKDFADTVAAAFNLEYIKEGFKFTAVKVSDDKESYWNRLMAAGISHISVDGTSFTIKAEELTDNPTTHDNAEFCRFLILYAQAIRLGIHKDKLSIFKDAIINKLKGNPKLLQAADITKGKDRFTALYVNAPATTGQDVKSVGFFKVCAEVLNNKKSTGIVLNPNREHIVIPSNILKQAFKDLVKQAPPKSFDLPVENQLESTLVQCSKCGKMWQIDRLDKNRTCPDCIAKVQTPTTTQPVVNNTSTQVSNAKAQNAHSTHRPNLVNETNRPKIVSSPINTKNYALWCMVCGIFSILIWLLSLISFDFAAKAIRQAKFQNEAVSAKVWIGIAASVASLLYFIILIVVVSVN